MSRTLSSVRERHKPVEQGTRSTHGSSVFGFDPHPAINPYYGSQAVVDAERNIESDGIGLRLQEGFEAPAAGAWFDVLSLTLSGGLWLLLGTLYVVDGGVTDGRIYDGSAELGLAGKQGSGDATLPVNALVVPRSGATYVLQGRVTVAPASWVVEQVCSLIAVRAYS